MATNGASYHDRADRQDPNLVLCLPIHESHRSECSSQPFLTTWAEVGSDTRWRALLAEPGQIPANSRRLPRQVADRSAKAEPRRPGGICPSGRRLSPDWRRPARLRRFPHLPADGGRAFPAEQRVLDGIAKRVAAFCRLTATPRGRRSAQTPSRRPLPASFLSKLDAIERFHLDLVPSHLLHSESETFKK